MFWILHTKDFFDLLGRKKIVFLIFYVFLLYPDFQVLSQETGRDSIRIPLGYILVLKDTVINPNEDTIVLLPTNYEYKIKYDPYFKSQNFYDSLRVRSSKKKWLAELYRLSIRNPNSLGKDTSDNVKSEVEYLQYEGLTINEIFITSVDVFTRAVSDTSLSSDKKFANFLNKTHISTRQKVIEKNLVFHEGEKINAYRLADNERILRSLNYIEDARIIVMPIDENSADVMVVTKDLFPIALSLSYSSIRKFDIGISHRNILGIGQGIRYRALFNANYSPVMGHQLEYGLSNISNSFISLYFKFRDTPINTTYFTRINKAFLTPETKYAGGFEFEYLRDRLGLLYPDTTIEYNFKRNTEKIWLGRSFRTSVKDRRNVIISAKYSRKLYMSRPDISVDTNQYFQNTSLLLGSVNLLKTKTIKTRFLRGYGRTEDVPVGYIFSLTSGYYWSDILNWYYGSFRLGFGHAFEKGGYFSFNTEFGSFFNTDGELFQSVFISKMLFYTPLLKLNRSRIRIGGAFTYEDGKNRYNYEWINLREQVKGLSSENTKGTSKTTLQIEMIYFSNTYFYGFRFAPYVFANLGLIRYNSPVIYQGKLHAGIGFGLRVKNESLVFPTLDLSFVFYTSNPTGNKKYQLDADATEPRVFDELNVGEPYVIPYGVSYF